MEEPKRKPKEVVCGVQGPGPKYMLPPTVGYIRHDLRKYRNPAYSLQFHHGTKYSTLGPGPYIALDHMTRKGPDTSPEYTIGYTFSPQTRSRIPGPGAHSPELCPPMNHNRRPPAFTIQKRPETDYTRLGPGPIYKLPTCIGPRVPDIKAEGAYSIFVVRPEKVMRFGPGPAQYPRTCLDLVKRQMPAYTIKERPDTNYKTIGPGPRYKPKYVPGKRAPTFNFGIRHSKCEAAVITELDDM